MTLKTIIQDLKKIREEEKLLTMDDTLFENAVKIYISGKITESKEKNIKTMSDINQPNTSYQNGYKSKIKPFNSSTEKQNKLLKKLGYTGNLESLSKYEAKKLIEEYLANQQNI